MNGIERMRADPSATRIENGSTNPELERRRQIMEQLCDLKIAKKVSDLDLYHGRASTGRPWEVDPYFNNGGNATNNRNINSIPALNAGSHEVAEQFGESRARRLGARSYEVHKIIARDPNAYIIDADAYHRQQFSEFQRQDIAKMIMSTLPRIGDACVFSYEDGKNVDQGALAKLENRTYHASEAPELARRYNLSLEGARQLLGAVNARIALANNLSHTMLRFVSSSSENDDDRKFPINRDYVAHWVESMGIIGTSYGVHSATLGKNVETYQFFSLDKIGSQEQLEAEKRRRNKKFGLAAIHTANLLSRNNRERLHNNDVLTMLQEDQYSTPHAIIEKAKENNNRVKNLFARKTGVWEGFTLQQHTETALSIFDKSAGDKLPSSLYTLGRLALIAHDLGKPIAAERHDVKNQKQYNIQEAANFLCVLDCNDETMKLVIHIISDGMQYVGEDLLAKGKDPAKHQRALDYCRDIAHEMSQGRAVGPTETTAAYDLCKYLVTADGGAYTSFATTKNGRISHRNSGGKHGQFDASFNVAGVTGQNLEFKA